MQCASVYLSKLLFYIQCTSVNCCVTCSVCPLPPSLSQALLTYFKTLNIPGAVLIFLPGWNSIFALHRHLSGHPVFGGWVSVGYWHGFCSHRMCIHMISPLSLSPVPSPSSSHSLSPSLLLRFTGVCAIALSLTDPSGGPEEGLCPCP